MTPDDILLTFVHISDTHLSHLWKAGPHSVTPPQHTLAALIHAINALPFVPDFILHTGDVCNDPTTAAEYYRAAEVFVPLRTPLYTLVGNHDRRAWMRSFFTPSGFARLQDWDARMIHEGRCWFEVELHGVQLVLLDSQDDSAAHPRGTIDDQQLAWLESICTAPDDRPLVVAIHHQVLDVGIPALDGASLVNGEAVHQVLKQAATRLRGVFCGHIHQPVDTLRDGILYCSVASSWYQFLALPRQTVAQIETDAEPGFNVVMISETQTYVRRHRYTVAL